MNQKVCNVLGDLLIKTGDNIKTGNCEIEEEQALDIISIIAHIPVSKETASSALNMSTSKFDSLVRTGKLPKGRKNRGFKELRWYVDELLPDIIKITPILNRMMRRL